MEEVSESHETTSRDFLLPAFARFDAILVTELTRWGRSTTDLIQPLHELHAWNVSLIAVNAPRPTA